MTRLDPRYDLDLETAERLLSLDATAVTPDHARLARVVWAAAAVADLDERTGEEQALAAFRVATKRSAARSHRRHRHPVHAKAAAWVVGLTVVFGGAIGAAAATGYLPESAQRAAQHLFEHVGINLPGPADPPDEEPVEPESAGPHPAEPDPATPDPAELEPTDPGPADPGPSEPEPGVAALEYQAERTDGASGGLQAEPAPDGTSEATDTDASEEDPEAPAPGGGPPATRPSPPSTPPTPAHPEPRTPAKPSTPAEAGTPRAESGPPDTTAQPGGDAPGAAAASTPPQAADTADVPPTPAVTATANADG